MNARATFEPITLLTLEPRMCAWPTNAPALGNAETTTFCGARTKPSRRYCAEHAAIERIKTPRINVERLLAKIIKREARLDPRS